MKISKIADLFVDFLVEFNENEFLNIKDFTQILCLEGVSEDLMNDCIEGCLRHLPVINKVIDLFINSLDEKKKSLLLKDVRATNTLKALFYLLVFEINKIGMKQLETIAVHFLNSNVEKFLRFVSSPNNVSGALQNVWLQFYDQLFVESVFVTPLLRLGPDLASVIEKIDVILLQRKKPKQTSKAYTIPKPFNFTVPQAKRVPEAKYQSSISICQKKPKGISKYKTKSSKITSKSERRLPKTAELIGFDENARYLQPKKSEKTIKMIEALLDEREKELQFDKPKISELPSFQPEMPVKQNTTTLLREAALVKKKIEEQMKKLEDLEQGTVMGAQLDKRLEELRNEEEERMNIVQDQNRLKGLLSREEALLAKQTVIEERKKQVQQFKVEMEENAKESHQLKQENEERTKMLVQQVMESENRTKEAVKLNIHHKRNIANKLQNDLNDGLIKAKEESDEMMKRRRLLVNEIRALKSESAQLRKSSNRQLDMMSVAQLHEHLELLKKWKKENEEEKRAQIRESKKSRMDKLNEVKQFIEHFRRRKNEQLEIDERKKMEPSPKQTRNRSKNVEVISLEKKLEEIKAQRMKLETQAACPTTSRDTKLVTNNAKKTFFKLV